MEASGVRLRVTISIGVALLDPARNTQAEVIAVADSALYEAKRRGRNCVASACSRANLALS
jgi:diguanylate cyclase (GGDEF)-like protein